MLYLSDKSSNLRDFADKNVAMAALVSTISLLQRSPFPTALVNLIIMQVETPTAIHSCYMPCGIVLNLEDQSPQTVLKHPCPHPVLALDIQGQCYFLAC